MYCTYLDWTASRGEKPSTAVKTIHARKKKRMPISLTQRTPEVFTYTILYLYHQPSQPTMKEISFPNPHLVNIREPSTIPEHRPRSQHAPFQP